MNICGKHPRYKVSRKPRANCKVCNDLWERKLKFKNLQMPDITIEIMRAPEPTSICGNAPLTIMQVDCGDMDKEEDLEIWTRITSGINALIGHLGPIPMNGWRVEFKTK